jgi:hypothetical protein
VNLKEFWPAFPVWVKEPRTAVKRVHLALRRLARVGLTQFLPTLRPADDFSAVKRTFAAVVRR